MKSSLSESPSQAVGASIRIGLSADDIKQAFRDNLICGMGRLEAVATKHDLYFALALTVRDRLFHRSVASIENYGGADARRVAYLSAEFLLGPHLANNLLNLGITEAAREAMSGLGYDLDEILAQEEEPGLGNGGLGRLAACYMDSLASVEVPALGYGIRYEFGIFDQVIRDGWQCEMTDKWLKNGNPWDIARSEIAYEVKFGGRTEAWADEQGRFRVRWIPRNGGARRRLRHADRRLPRWHLQHAAPLESRGRRVVRLCCVQPGRLRPRGRGQSRVGDDHQSALPERRGAPGQGAPAQAAVLFHELLVAGYAAHPSAARRHSRRPSTKNGPCSSTTRTPRSPSRS